MRPARGAAIFRRWLAFVWLPGALLACSPSLDWREARPEGSGATVWFPCRPSSMARVVPLAGAAVPMRLHSCTAAGTTFSFAVAEVGTAGRVPPVLAALRAQAAANVSGKATALPPPTVDGATPNPESGWLRIDGTLPDGRAVVEHAAFLVRGTRVYQATVIGAGAPVGQEALDNFFAAIRLR